MCDYSLEMYRSRPAQVGEEYETRCFPSRTVGLISKSDPSTAVCVACDTRLKFEDIPEAVQKSCGVTATEEVVFTRLETGPHHDGVRFSNGSEITLQQLGSGVKATLIDSLSGSHETEERGALEFA